MGYGTLLHGEAVAIGMVHASQLAERLGHVDSTVTERQLRLLQAVQLPTSIPSARLDVAATIDRMRLDKKTVGGQLRFVLPTRIGQVELVDSVPEATVRSLLTELARPQ